MTIGKRITKFRKEQKLSQEKLSEKLSITRQTLSNYENDITIPDIEMANNIAKTLNVSLDELLGNDLSFIEGKLNSNEKLTKKNSILLKILLITIYFVLLITLICVMIYFFNKKDFTTKYQTEIICSKKEVDAIRYMKLTLEDIFGECPDGELSCWYKINNYTPFIITSKEGLSNQKEPSKGYAFYTAGYSFSEAIDSLQVMKNILITQGFKCK